MTDFRRSASLMAERPSYPFAEKICDVAGCERWAIHGDTLCDPCKEAEEEGATLPRKKHRTPPNPAPRAYDKAQYIETRRDNKAAGKEKVAQIVAEVMEASRQRRTKKCPDCGIEYLGPARRCLQCKAIARAYYCEHRNDARAAARAAKRESA